MQMLPFPEKSKEDHEINLHYNLETKEEGKSIDFSQSLTNLDEIYTDNV